MDQEQQGIAAPVIPTATRFKIAHTDSYPLGAEVISRALADTPQFADLLLHFSPLRWVPTSADRVRFLSVNYSRRFNSYSPVSRNGVPLSSTWEIRVHAVLRSVRHRVKQYAITEGLPIIRDWLQKRADLRNYGGDLLAFVFVPEEDAFVTEASTELEPLRS